VYLTNGGFDGGALLVYTADLQPLWSEAIPGNNLGGPVLADDGTLIVCGTGTLVRAYRSPTGDVAHEGAPDRLRLLGPATPNPFCRRTALRLTLDAPGAVSLRIHDAQGRLVRTLLSRSECGVGTRLLRWDGCDGTGAAVPSGLYFATLQTASRSEVRKLMLSR
ncbi:MAG: T9SS type A sorting domain-containing protein, partial [Candidatus Eisenbacteria bacterium]|nr:T9SS type A sorting domain-containing protein [Candidatus Eisenbacteria bacterium]